MTFFFIWALIDRLFTRYFKYYHITFYFVKITFFFLSLEVIFREKKEGSLVFFNCLSRYFHFAKPTFIPVFCLFFLKIRSVAQHSLNLSFSLLSLDLRLHLLKKYISLLHNISLLLFLAISSNLSFSSFFYSLFYCHF